jgi:hypothetical protein
MAFFGLVNFDEKVDGFQDVVLVHHFLAFFLQRDKLIHTDQIMVSLEKIVGPVEIFVNL